MLNAMEKTIIIKALCIRQERGEKPEEVMAAYHNLSAEEKSQILEEVSSVPSVK